MNENENLNIESQDAPKEQTMDYSFDFSNQVSNATPANNPQAPIAPQPVENIAPQQPIEQTVEANAEVPAQPQVIAPIEEPQVIAAAQPAVEQVQPVVPEQPVVEQVQPVVQTESPVQSAQPEVMATLEEPQVAQPVQTEPSVENINAPQEVATEAIQTTEEPKAEKDKETNSWKNTLMFGIIVLAIVVVFIIALPFINRIGG